MIKHRNLVSNKLIIGFRFVHIHCRAIDILISHDLLSSDLVAQSVDHTAVIKPEGRLFNSHPIVRVFPCPRVGPIPSVGLTLTSWSMGRKLALHLRKVYHNEALSALTIYTLRKQRSLQKFNQLSLYSRKVFPWAHNHDY